MTKYKESRGVKFLLSPCISTLIHKINISTILEILGRRLTFLCLFTLLTRLATCRKLSSRMCSTFSLGLWLGSVLSLSWAHSPLVHEMRALYDIFHFQRGCRIFGCSVGHWENDCNSVEILQNAHFVIKSKLDSLAQF